MDQTLVDLLGPAMRQDKAKVKFHFVAPESDEIDIAGPTGRIRYTPKPLRELYGKGQGGTSVNPRDERYEPLFLSIEQEIAAYDSEASKLTDGLVQLTLERMSMDPAGECGQDELCRRLQRQLRLLLSVNDYSRQEVKTALRTIARSVARHKNLEGRRGYLEFIHRFFG